VFDEHGNLVVSDIDTVDYCYVSWTPLWTGEFTVEVRNIGSGTNFYDLETN
jgi:hypothetical protein